MKLYTKTVCPRCLWLKSEARRSGKEVEIVNIDCDETARDRLVNAGIASVPVLEADGQFLLETKEILARLGCADA